MRGCTQVSSEGQSVIVRHHSRGRRGFADSGQSVLLERVVWVPIRRRFTLRVFCLSQETSQKEEAPGKFEVKMEVAKASSPHAPQKTTFKGGGTRLVSAMRSGM